MSTERTKNTKIIDPKRIEAVEKYIREKGVTKCQTKAATGSPSLNKLLTKEAVNALRK